MYGSYDPEGSGLVIYAGEETTGITWHYVTAGVDEGGFLYLLLDADTLLKLKYQF